MTQTAALIYTGGYSEYCLAPDHPFSPLRWELTWDLVNSMGITEEARVVGPEPARVEDLTLVHTKPYVDAVRYISDSLEKGGRDDLVKLQVLMYRYGLAGPDTPSFAGMHEAAALIVGGTLTAGKLVVDGEVQHAVNFGGGLHHAMPSRASGFCIYNDVAILIKKLRLLGLRVAYVDLDAHHGDGVQHAFYDDAGVLTYSVHEDGRYLFPGSGFENERGEGLALGTKWNVPLEPLAGDDELLDVVETQLPEVIEEFDPDVLVTQHGCDGHAKDPLTHLRYTMRSFLRLPALMHKLAHEYAQGRWVAVGGGGYDAWRVTPRAWAAVCAAAAHIPIGPDTALPKEFLVKWASKSPVELPKTFGEDTPVT